MKSVGVFGVLVTAATLTMAGPELDSVRAEHAMLSQQVDTCSIQVRTLFVYIRMRQLPDPPIDVQRCVEDGKATLKNSYEKIGATFGRRKAPGELADWRLEWMTRFDAAMPQDGETERDYLQRQAQARQGVDRAKNKLEMSLE